MRPSVIVVGAGLAGLSTAWFLREGGAEVTVLERRQGAGLETSFANGSLLHPSLAEPWNSPGMLKFLLRNIGRSSSPMLLRWRALPGMLGWGAKFVQQSAAERYWANTVSNVRLANFSLQMMQVLREARVVDYSSYCRGTLLLHRSPDALQESRCWFERLTPHGIKSQSLDAASVLALEPALQPIADQIAGGIHAVDDEGGDPRAYCQSLAQSLIRRGVDIRYQVDILDWLRTGERVCGLIDRQGREYRAGMILLAAASYSPLLVKPLGLSLPIRPVKGYSITLPRGTGAGAPAIPVIDPALHMAVVPVGEDRIRVAGTAEFAGYDTSIDPDRIENLVRLIHRLYPVYAGMISPQDIQPWAGLRGVCPDGVPLIGATRVPGLYLNAGHGHLGWTLAAGSGRLAADLMLGNAPSLDAAAYNPRRF